MMTARGCIALQAMKRRATAYGWTRPLRPAYGSDDLDAPQKPHFPDYHPLPLLGFAVRRNCYIQRRVPDCRPAREPDPVL